LHKYCCRLGLDLLVPGLDPLLTEPAEAELDAMQAELSKQLADRQSSRWVTTDTGRQMEARRFHWDTAVPSVRKFAVRQSGLARLLVVRKLGQLGVSVEEARLVTTG
ncbi:hypothetical protein Agub_g4563, partial [Astrephomene gubernaculifera]